MLQPVSKFTYDTKGGICSDPVRLLVIEETLDIINVSKQIEKVCLQYANRSVYANRE